MEVYAVGGGHPGQSCHQITACRHGVPIIFVEDIFAPYFSTPAAVLRGYARHQVEQAIWLDDLRGCAEHLRTSVAKCCCGAALIACVRADECRETVRRLPIITDPVEEG